jgi:hypothetical protein
MSGETTEVFWEASGGSLHTEAWSVSTKGGSRFAVPNKRGENLQIPFLTGTRASKKYRDERGLALPMWMIPRNADGTRPPGLSNEQISDRNWLYLMGPFDTEDLFPLTKRWYDQVDGHVRVATAMAEMLDGPQRTDTGGGRTEFTVDLILPDPWFYGEEITVPMGEEVVIEGNRPTSRVKVSMTAGRVDFPDGNWIDYDSSGTVLIDCHTCTAKRGSTYVNGHLDRNPLFPDWGTLRPGAATIGGVGTVTYSPAWV